MAKKIKLSASRISTFLNCKQKYWFNYEKKLPKVGNPSFHLGLAVHESLEFAGKIWLEKGKFTKKDTEQIMELYDRVAIREGLEDLSVHAEGKLLVKKRLNEFLSGKKIIGLETKFGFWGKDAGPQIVSKYGVPLIGAIDKIEEFDEDTLLIIDYKTSKTSPTVEQLKTDVQLSIYDLVAKQMFPNYKRIALALDLLKSDIMFTYRTETEREEFEIYLKIIYDEMVSLKEEDVRASLNIFCPWCDYKDYCSTYQKACHKSDYNFLPTMQYTDDQLVNEWENVKATKKILEKRERELGMIMTEKIKRNAGNIKLSDKEIYVRQNSRIQYDLDTVNKLVPTEDFPNLVTLNKKAVETYMLLNPAIKDDILDTSVTSYTNPFLASRKIKKPKKSKKTKK